MLDLLNRIDHLVYSCPNLDEGMSFIEELFGVAPVYGGKHLTKGTHNAILGLGNQTYFEIIAPDPNNQSVKYNRWMGVDLVKDKGRLTRWAIKSRNIEQDAQLLKNYNTALAVIEEGSRKKANGDMLYWKLTNPLPTPLIELSPFLIDWGEESHPTDNLTSKCKLLDFSLGSPNPTNDTIAVLSNLGIKLNSLKASHNQLIVKLETPNGIIELV